MSADLHLKEENGRRASAKLLINKISKIKKSRRLLDIGIVTVVLLDETVKVGYEVQGIDLSQWAVNFA